jgi:Ca2+-dependent lipid-binding protein
MMLLSHLTIRPFILSNPSNLTLTFLGVPKVEVSVVPLSKHLPNVLDLPLVSGFVQSAIAAAANEYVAPKSLTLNLAQILMGDGVKKDTVAVGILMIKIHHATGLKAQDWSASDRKHMA